MDRGFLVGLGRAGLPIVALVSFFGGLAATLAFAGDTLGFDFLAYHQAAVRLVGGEPLYDMSYTTTGGFGLFYYPPTFAPLILPLGFLSAATATWAWIAGLVVAFVIGTAILPVSRPVRWWILLLAGWSFPFVYAVKLGQVGPLLFLTAAVGWRWIDAPVPLGASTAIGTAIKLQPGVLLLWALLTRRFAAVVVGAAVLAGLALLATVLAGTAAWGDFLTLVRAVSDPISTPHNFTPGAVAFRLGVSSDLASLIQLASMVGAIGVLLVAIRWSVAEASYLAAVVVGQLISPILWDHYAILLLLPVAYLLAAGRWWALAIPLVTAWPFVAITPPIAYPVAFWVTLLATTWVGRAARPATAIGEPVG